MFTVDTPDGYSRGIARSTDVGERQVGRFILAGNKRNKRSREFNKKFHGGTDEKRRGKEREIHTYDIAARQFAYLSPA